MRSKYLLSNIFRAVEEGPFYIIILNKLDLIAEEHSKKIVNNIQKKYQNVAAISSLTQEGFPEFMVKLKEMLEIL